MKTDEKFTGVSKATSESPSSGDGDGETTDAEAMNQLASVVGGFVQVNLKCISLLQSGRSGPAKHGYVYFSAIYSAELCVKEPFA